MTSARPNVLPLLERALALGGLLLMTDAIISLLRGAEMDAAGPSPTQGYEVFQYLAMAVYALTGVLLLKHVQGFIRLCREHKLLILIIGWVMISTLWSVSFDLSFRRGVALMGTTLFALWLVLRFPPMELLRLVAMALGITMVASFIVGLAVPEYGVHQSGTHYGDWRGVYAQKNVLGRLACLAAITYAVLATNREAPQWRRQADLAMVGLSVFLVVMSGSRVAWVLAIVAAPIAVLAYLLRSHRSIAATTIMVTPLVALVIALGVVMNFDELMFALGRDTTLTGRTTVWGLAVESAMERPWLGWGYRAFWHTDSGVAAMIRYGFGWEAFSTGHNGYLDLWIELGLVGGALVFLLLLRVLVDVVKASRQGHPVVALWCFMVLGWLVMANMAASLMLSRNNIVWVVFVILVCYARPQAMAGLISRRAVDDEPGGHEFATRSLHPTT